MPFMPARRILIVVENLPVPLDRRVWLEATTLVEAGYEVSVICPMGRGWVAPYEVIDGVQSVVFDEAENRLHAQKSILAWCLGAI